MNSKREDQREMSFNSLHQIGSYDDRAHHPKPKQQDQELMCACGSNVKCDGICRELYLHRPRMTNPMVKTKQAKNYIAGVQKNKNWADRCPSAYEKP